MSEQHDPFSPHHVDEAVEQLFTAGQFDQRGARDASERLVQDMQRFYSLEGRQYQRAMQRVQDRLLARFAHPDEQPTAPINLAAETGRRQAHARKKTQGRFTAMEYRQPAQSSPPKFARRAGLLAAVLVVVVLVGSLALVLRATHQNHTGTGPAPGATVTPIPTQPKLPIGTTVYTTPANKAGFYNFAWSPDSQRVAALSDGVRIWNATTGAHLVTVQIPTYTSASVLAWSPNGNLLALGTTVSDITLVNGDTGAVVKNYSVKAPTGLNTNTSSAALSAEFPANGGGGIHGLAWSPDGKYLAVAFSTSSFWLLVVNAQTGALAYSLPLSGNYIATTLAWSPDGKYVAADVFNQNWDGQQASSSQANMVWAWDVSTRQVVFKHAGGLNSGHNLAWQPRSDNLAFSSWQARSGGGQILVLAIWNVASGKPVHEYKAYVQDSLDWSADGRYLAYIGIAAPEAGQTPVANFNQKIDQWVSILDVESGRSVYIYKQHKRVLSAMDWSPDGRYIISGEGNAVGDPMVAKVWAAE